MSSAKTARDKAIARVAAATPPTWAAVTRQVVLRLARSGQPFTTDDVWRRVSHPPEPRALGAVMVALQKAGKIRPRDEWRLSERRECHARPIRVWEGTRG